MSRQREREYISGIVQHGRRFRFEVGLLDGTRKIESYDTREEAEIEHKAAHRARDRAERAAQALSWAQAIEGYCGGLAETGALPRSVETVRGRLKRYFAPVLEDVAQITAEGAERLYRDLRVRKSQAGKDLSVQEHRHCLSRAKALGAWMVEKKHWRANPLSAVKAMGKPNRGKPQLTRDESRTLIAWILAPEQARDEGAAATLILLVFGLRASELCALEARDVDDGGSLLHVRGTKTDAARRDLVVPGPTPEQPHVVDVRGVLLAQVERARRRPRGEVPCISPVLWGRDRWWVHREVTRCCERAGVPVVPPHGLRGTNASLARSAGAAPQVVADSLGHAGTAVQERHYALPGAVAAGHQQAVRGVLAGVAIPTPKPHQS